MMKSVRSLLTTALALLLGGCLGMPAGVQPVQKFNLKRYLGTWYEVARLDHSFERGLSQVTANYSLRDDGGVKVINRGYDTTKNLWKEAEGRAYFVRGPDEGYLKVSFFGPFYGSYVVFELDRENYQYAFVSSYNLSFLWLLARTPTVPTELLDRFVATADRLGFPTEQLIFADQN